MKLKIAVIVPALLLFFSTAAAQKKLSDAEVQYFYKLIRESKEFKALRATKDSLNRNEYNVPQALDILMLKKDRDADNKLFWAKVDRTIMGMSLESYLYSYDQKKKEIVSVEKLKPGAILE
jgi:hypothetical protein